jgi:hypothetical protein
MLGEPSFPAPVGVGSNDPHPVSSMRTADVPSAQHTPRRIIPQAGKPRQHGSESACAEIGAIFCEDKRRPNFANDAQHFKPEARSASCKACSVAGAGDVLAGEASADDVNAAPPGVAIERADVIPDREGLEMSVALALGEHSLAVGLNLDRADGPPSKQPGGKQASAGPGK